MDDKWQELRQLETQRTGLITKLGKIEEKKEMVSNEVYEKVKGEYEEKLRHIDANMNEHIDLIKEELVSIQGEETKLQEEEKNTDLQIEEIELRYSIGEYDEASYTEQSEEKKDALGTTRTNLENLRKRKQWLEDFTQIKDIEQTIEHETPAEPAPVEPKPEQSEPEQPKPEQPEPEQPEPEQSEPEQPEPEQPEPEQPEAEIQIEEHILEKISPEEGTKLDELLVEEDAVKQEVIEEVKTEQESPAQPAEEKEKSTPCPKCGHLNALDSWYCEKCGAEVLDSPSSQ